MQTIKDICTEYNITQTELSKRFGIPLRTVQDWYAGRRIPPDYVVELIAYRVANDPAIPKTEDGEET